MKNGGEAKVDLSGAMGQEFSVQWYNPRAGGDLIDGTPGTVNGSSENVPTGAANKEIHLILDIKDKNPIASLYDYRRIVIKVNQ